MITHARMTACSDVRMSYTQWVMLKACTDGLSAQQIWNWDATQIVSNNSTHANEVFVVNENTKTEPLSIVGDERLGFGIKWLHLASAAGEYGPLIFIVAVENMSDNDYWVEKVFGLSQCNSSSSFGYLVFCKNRSANSAFYEWFITNIAVPTINLCRDKNNLKVNILIEDIYFYYIKKDNKFYANI